MSNTARHRVTVDLAHDGRVIIWTPAGPVSCMDERQAAKILIACAKAKETIWPVRQQPIPQEYETETFEEFIARGGEVKIINPPKESTPRGEMEKLSLEDLGL